MNSTDVLQELRRIEKQRGYNAPVSISNLAANLDISVNKLVSILIELEHRDEVALSITNNQPGIPGALYQGHVKLLETPPDEQ